LYFLKADLNFFYQITQEGAPKLENIISLIRRATSNDYEQIRKIIDLSFPRVYRCFASQSVTSKEGKVLVAQTEGVIFGFAKLIEFDIKTFSYGCILWIAVHPLYGR
jgi:hypothetical protein